LQVACSTLSESDWVSLICGIDFFFFLFFYSLFCFHFISYSYS
jgi:hypothetical protein